MLLAPSARFCEGATRAAAQAQAHCWGARPDWNMPVDSAHAPECRREMAVGGGRGKREGVLVLTTGGSRAEVVACGSSGLATDEGADSGAVRGVGGGREAAELL